ncbi:MAG: licheninase, partial [Planctomycetaceae bacterium]|nr:licheninase [Planctomycetaceae bacterium]
MWDSFFGRPSFQHLTIMRTKITIRGARKSRSKIATIEQLEDRTLLSTFADNFDLPAGSQPSTGSWMPFNASDPNSPIVHYSNSTSTLQIVNAPGTTDGKALAMSIEHDPENSALYLSSEIRTVPISGSNQVLYGRIEASIKLPGGPNGEGTGIWPAFWLYGNSPGEGEIDIMEYRGENTSQIQGSIHAPGLSTTG